MSPAFISRPLTRRQLIVGTALGASALTLLPAPSLLAQATPTTGANYPELTVTITDQELKASATEVPSGYVKLTVINLSKDSNSASFLGPGKGQTMDDLKKAMSTVAASGGNTFPPAIYQAAIPGGPGDMQPATTGSAIVHVTDGDWVIVPEGNQMPLFVTAKAGSGSNETEPQSAVTITEVDFAFGGFDAPIPAGTQTWKVVNTGMQPHFLGVFGVPAGTTVAQVLALVTAESSNATPQAGGLKESDITSVNPSGVMIQSSGTTVFPIMNLDKGHYAAACFMPDERTGQPHILEGMLAVFDVGTATTPVATPAS
jgi:hypothetical protein